MIRRVEHGFDTRNHLLDFDFYPLLQSHVGHPTSLATALQANIDGISHHIDERNMPAMGRDGRVDPLLQEFLDGDTFGRVQARLRDGVALVANGDHLGDVVLKHIENAIP